MFIIIMTVNASNCIVLCQVIGSGGQTTIAPSDSFKIHDIAVLRSTKVPYSHI